MLQIPSNYINTWYLQNNLKTNGTKISEAWIVVTVTPTRWQYADRSLNSTSNQIIQCEYPMRLYALLSKWRLHCIGECVQSEIHLWNRRWLVIQLGADRVYGFLKSFLFPCHNSTSAMCAHTTSNAISRNQISPARSFAQIYKALYCKGARWRSTTLHHAKSHIFPLSISSLKDAVKGGVKKLSVPTQISVPVVSFTKRVKWPCERPFSSASYF